MVKIWDVASVRMMTQKLQMKLFCATTVIWVSYFQTRQYLVDRAFDHHHLVYKKDLVCSCQCSCSVKSHMFYFIRLGLNVALTYQNRSYRDRETKENVEEQERKKRGGNVRKRTATTKNKHN